MRKYKKKPVRVCYWAESLIGNCFFAVHEPFVLLFLKRLGLTIHADKPSRIDMQVMINVSAVDFIRLFDALIASPWQFRLRVCRKSFANTCIL